MGNEYHWGEHHYSEGSQDFTSILLSGLKHLKSNTYLPAGEIKLSLHELQSRIELLEKVKNILSEFWAYKDLTEIIIHTPERNLIPVKLKFDIFTEDIIENSVNSFTVPLILKRYISELFDNAIYYLELFCNNQEAHASDIEELTVYGVIIDSFIKDMYRYKNGINSKYDTLVFNPIDLYNTIINF